MDAYNHDVNFRATDNAGNRSSVDTLTVPISPDAPMVGNIAPFAVPTASYTSGWNSVDALNDGQGVNRGGSNGLVWGTWTGNEPESRWIQYTWGVPVTVDSTEIMFWSDSTAGSGAGVAVPESWFVEYWDATTEAWVQVGNPSEYGVADTGTNVTTFDAVTTTQLRATLMNHPNEAGTSRSAVAVSEWQVFAVEDGEPADTVAPEVAAVVDVEARTVALTATDTESGVETVEYRVGDGAWTAYAAPIAVGDGAVTVFFRATDVAGNVSAEASVDVAAVEPDPDPGVPDFADVVEGQVFYDEIRWMAETGLSNGTVIGDRTFFYPAQAVSRQAMAAFIYRYAGADYTPVEGQQSFTDVGPGHPFYVEIEWMAAQDLADGYDDGSFGATRPVSRQAMAAFLHRLAGSPAASSASSFTDVTAGNQFAEAIGWLAETEITQGYPDGSFGTTRPVSRQAVAAFMYRYDRFISVLAVTQG